MEGIRNFLAGLSACEVLLNYQKDGIADPDKKQAEKVWVMTSKCSLLETN